MIPCFLKAFLCLRLTFKSAPLGGFPNAWCEVQSQICLFPKMASLLSQYPLFKIHLYHLDLTCHLYHLLVSYMCPGLPWDCSVHWSTYPFRCYTDFITEAESNFRFSDRTGLLLMLFFFFFKLLLECFAYLFFHINVIPCLVPGGNKICWHIIGIALSV